MSKNDQPSPTITEEQIAQLTASMDANFLKAYRYRDLSRRYRRSSTLSMFSCGIFVGNMLHAGKADLAWWATNALRLSVLAAAMLMHRKAMTYLTHRTVCESGCFPQILL